MRTTVDLPCGLHRRVTKLAAERGASLSATVAELTAMGMASLQQDGDDIQIDTDSGFPILHLGAMTSEDVAELLAD